MILLMAFLFSSLPANLAVLAGSLVAFVTVFKYIIKPIWNRIFTPILEKNILEPIANTLADKTSFMGGKLLTTISSEIASSGEIRTLSDTVQKNFLELKSSLDKIVHEVTTNNGSSIKDSVKRIEADAKEVEGRKIIGWQGFLDKFAGLEAGQTEILNKIADQSSITDAHILETRSRWRILAKDAIGAAYYETDVNGKFVFVNKKWLELTGLDESEALGDGWRSTISEIDRQELVAAWDKAIANKTDFGPIDYHFTHKDGHDVKIRGSAAAIFSGNNTVIGWVGIVEER